jgi:gliding motility-associated-like protein
MKFKAYGLIIFIVALASSLSVGQTYFVCQRVGFQDYLYKLKLNCLCPGCCDLHLIGSTGDFVRGMTMSPDGKLYGCDWNNHIYEVDTLTGTPTLIFSLPSEPKVQGLVTLGGGIFYSFLEISNSLADTLIGININTGIVTKLGVVPDKAISELTVYNGEIYYHWVYPNNWNIQDWGIAKLNINDPAASTQVVTCEFPCCFGGLSATNRCQTLLSSQLYGEEKLVTISLVDGSITEICDMPNDAFVITSMEEFSSPVGCNTLDLDCNDSSGATDADFNAHEINCLSNQCGIVDTDLLMIYDDSISMVTVQLNGPLPDAPDEFLKYTASIPGVSATGTGTDMITLTNNGTGIGSNFRNALKAIHYTNLANPVTPGQRTIEVQYTLNSGVISNLATTYITVVELPVLQVDLGPDDILCQGKKDTLDAGNPNAIYHWSNNLTTQTIITNQSGNYAVTVTKNGYCPGSDTISVDVVPVIHVSLDGPQGVCINNSATLIINTDSPFPLTIEIGSSTGSSFVLNDVTDNFTFTDSPTQGTLYTILTVTPSMPACIDLQDSVQFIEVFPTYSMLADTSMCEGDSLFIANHWVTQGGNYNYTYSTAAGCDSTVTTFVIAWPATHIAIQSATCDSAAAGIFVSVLNNPNGCDTIVTKTVTVLPPDTTLINLLSCNISNVGSTAQTLTNQSGCDSLIITTTNWVPPADTTLLFQHTCDSSLLGVFPQFLFAQDGCDSIVITTVTMAPSDTTYFSDISCDSANIGVFQVLLSNRMGCDSLIITTISAGMPDTILIFKTSCDPTELGVTEIHYTTPQGCDSVVITTVSFSAQDSTFIASSSCNLADVGVFVQALTNGFGCDSIVTTTVSLLPASESFISTTTCDPSAAGNFDHLLINQFGCDSIVHETVSLLPSSETFLSSTTCTSSQAGTFITTLQNQYGCDSVVTLTVSLIPADTTQLISKTCDPAQVGNTQNAFTNQYGCDSLVIQTTALFPLPQLIIQVASDFNGYGISCFGESDGSALANVAGIGPYQYLWSTGSLDQSITGLSSGVYSVTITDGNGCQTNSTVSISEPEEFSIGFEVSQPDCFDNQKGIITVMQTDGVLPIRYSIDGINFQSSPVFNSLPSGTYTLTAIDANDCDVQEIIWINVPLEIHVDLGMDRIILPGDTTILEAILNVPFDSLSTISWSGLLNANCPTCLTQPVAPIITTTYSISVSNSQGCSDQDSVVVATQKNMDVYIPNVFSPNGDGINDRLLISAASEVEEIASIEIFDRWGNMVFVAMNFPPNDPSFSWDGKRDGVAMNPGVFAFRMIARFKDGRIVFRNGDVTLIR